MTAAKTTKEPEKPATFKVIRHVWTNEHGVKWDNNLTIKDAVAMVCDHRDHTYYGEKKADIGVRTNKMLGRVMTKLYEKGIFTREEIVEMLDDGHYK